LIFLAARTSLLTLLNYYRIMHVAGMRGSLNNSSNPRASFRLFRHRYRQYGLWERYAELYPGNDPVFTVGESDPSKDWFFAHVTR
jgi:hypothetical protein